MERNLKKREYLERLKNDALVKKYGKVYLIEKIFEDQVIKNLKEISYITNTSEQDLKKIKSDFYSLISKRF